MIAESTVTSPNGPLEQIVVLQRPNAAATLNGGRVGGQWYDRPRCQLALDCQNCSSGLYSAGRPAAAAAEHALKAQWTNPPRQARFPEPRAQCWPPRSRRWGEGLSVRDVAARPAQVRRTAQRSRKRNAQKALKVSEPERGAPLCLTCNTTPYSPAHGR